jgi:hypothetical protein
LEHFKAALGIQDGKGGFARNLWRAFGHPDQQPDLILIPKYPGIQKARHFHACEARTEVPWPEDRVLPEALCQIAGHALFAFLRLGYSHRHFTTQQN